MLPDVVHDSDRRKPGGLSSLCNLGHGGAKAISADGPSEIIEVQTKVHVMPPNAARGVRAFGESSLAQRTAMRP